MSDVRCDCSACTYDRRMKRRAFWRARREAVVYLLVAAAATLGVLAWLMGVV
jgi:hypothetical protein